MLRYPKRQTSVPTHISWHRGVLFVCRIHQIVHANYQRAFLHQWGLSPMTTKNIRTRKIPKPDALHIAISTVEDVGYLVVWNMEHTAKERTRRIVDNINFLCEPSRLYVVTPKDFVDWGCKDDNTRRKGDDMAECAERIPSGPYAQISPFYPRVDDGHKETDWESHEL